MNINTCSFSIKVSSEEFARELYQRWDNFFQHSFESIVEEELSALDSEADILEMDSLVLNLGIVPEDGFDQEFEKRLREKLRSLRLHLSREQTIVDAGDIKVNIQRKTKSLSAYECLVFFLLHGCLQDGVDEKFSDVSYLLQLTLASSSSALRGFLEAYGHYDFVLRRLSQQFSDEELEQLVGKLHPDESKFICLYVRLHRSAQKKNPVGLQMPFVTESAYRDVLWQVVFSYLYTEGKSWFSRKQFVSYTLRGLAAHYGCELSSLVRWVTFSLDEMDAFRVYREDFTKLLTELATENSVPSFGTMDVDALLSVLRPNASETSLHKEFLLSRDNLVFLFSDERKLRRVVSLLPEQGIRKVVSLLFPQDADFIFSFDSRIEGNKNRGVLTGKCGNEYSQLKWQFVLRVAIGMPEAGFNRTFFVQSVIRDLSNHYNVGYLDLLRLFLEGVESQQQTPLTTNLTAILMGLQRLYEGETENRPLSSESLSEVCGREDLMVIVRDGTLFEKFYSLHVVSDLEKLVSIIHPADSAFLVAHAHYLEQYRDGLLEGKANEGFSLLKWRILFSCLIFPQGSVYSRKIYVLRVMKELSAHYNLSLSEVLKSYWLMLEETDPLGRKEREELLGVVKTLFLELVQDSGTFSLTEDETRKMLLLSFGQTGVPTEYQRRLLDYVIHENPRQLAELWRSGELSWRELFGVMQNDLKCLFSFLTVVSDSRINRLLEELKQLYHQLAKCGVSASLLRASSEQLLTRLALLASKSYFSWSVDEIKACLRETVDLSALRSELAKQGHSRLPSSIFLVEDGAEEETLLRKKLCEQLDSFRPKNDLEGLLAFEVVAKKQDWTVENAGIVLLTPFFPRLFQYAGYLNQEGKDFLDDENRIRAIFLLLYLVYGEEREHKEAELFLNRLLVGLKCVCPIPLSCKLTEQETKLADSMLVGLKQQWSKLQNTSDEAFRVSFLQRSATLKCEKEQAWQMKVQERSYDILLETIPWSFKMIKYRWMDRIIVVEWK
ncbi:MAG: hypothetical protein J5554_08730 [Paludibacteraceae bacterium]|nr:hypothetical protein [Paludibacteraceae bacterium]